MKQIRSIEEVGPWISSLKSSAYDPFRVSPFSNAQQQQLKCVTKNKRDMHATWMGAKIQSVTSFLLLKEQP